MISTIDTLKNKTTNFDRLEWFDGIFIAGEKIVYSYKDFESLLCYQYSEANKRWKMNIYLVLVREKWDQDDDICRGHILFDAYHNVPTAKELQAQLQERYIKEDAINKRFIITRFNSYRMIDSRSVMEQFSEIKVIVDQQSQHNMKMDEDFIVTFIVDKFPPSWKNFRNSLKHKKGEPYS